MYQNPVLKEMTTKNPNLVAIFMWIKELTKYLNQ